MVSLPQSTIFDAGGSPTWTTSAGQLGSDTVQNDVHSVQQLLQLTPMDKQSLIQKVVQMF